MLYWLKKKQIQKQKISYQRNVKKIVKKYICEIKI